jgi:CBS-domain-containing membrane protein
MNTTVSDVMTRQVIAAREDADFKEIVAVTQHGRVSALPVLDAENRVIGVVSEADLLAKEAASGGQHACCTGHIGPRSARRPRSGPGT